jgi:NADH-quinone oxidoreductase subunit L
MFGALALGGYAAGVLHLLAHGAFKALLFLAAGAVIHAVGTQTMTDMGGLGRHMRFTYPTMTIGLAALAGVPPLVGFFSKDAVLGVAWEQATHDGSTDGWLILVAGMITVGLTAAYATRTWLLVFQGPRRTDVVAHEAPPLMTGPLLVLAALTVVGGVVVLWPAFLGVDAEPFHLAPALLGLAVVVLAAAATWAEWSRHGQRDPANSLGWIRPVLSREFSYDELVRHLVVRPVMGSADVTRVAEADVVETYVRGGDGAAQWSGRLLRGFHNGNLQRYVTAVVVGAVAVAVALGVSR